MFKKKKKVINKKLKDLIFIIKEQIANALKKNKFEIKLLNQYQKKNGTNLISNKNKL